jgi:tetratricopeptide (TPR) repeat protein
MGHLRNAWLLREFVVCNPFPKYMGYQILCWIQVSESNIIATFSIEITSTNSKIIIMTELTPWRTFSIFISSTFADMQAERDYLKSFVFPRVRGELEKHRIKLEVVDLRWGVDTTSIEQEDKREATVLKVCLDEIKRCKPFFIGLLGDRYGWVPPEERMKNALLGEDMETETEGKSVTALEIEFGVLASREQLNRSVFYFREPFDYSTLTPEKAAMFSDEYNPELTEEQIKERTSSLEKLKADIIGHFEKQGLKGEELEKKVKNYSCKWDAKEQKVKGLQNWGNAVYEDIIRECKSHARDTWHKTPKNPQEQERALLEAFIERHTHITTRGEEEIPTFCGREKLLNELKQHLLTKDKKSWGLVLTGESGSGKSAVFSMIYKMMQKEDCLVLAHSAGLSPKSKRVIELLHGWNKQLSNELSIEYEEQQETEIPDAPMPGREGLQQRTRKPEIEKIQDKFRELLFTVAKQKQVVLLIDALDRFEPTQRAKFMTWMPTVMPGNIRMICTAITGTEQNAIKYHSELFAKSIDSFTPSEAKEMLNMLCRRQHKSLPATVETIILEKKRENGLPAASSPLWLSLAVNIMMAMDSDDFEKMKQLEGRGDVQITKYMEELAKEFPPLSGKLFLSLIDKAASIFKEGFTHKVFNYIACSRNGLRESDLEQLIPQTENDNWDALMFAGLRHWFTAHLREEGDGLQWNLVHSILRNTLIEEMDKETFKRLHNEIASLLLSLAAGDTLRASETMYHLLQAENTGQGVKYYTDELTEDEEAGATTVLAEAISNNEKGLDFCFELTEAAKENEERLWQLAKRFIYNLNETLEIEGNLDNRTELLKKLNSYLSQTESNYLLNTVYGYDYAALYERLGAIYQDIGNFDQALEYFNKYNELSKKLYESNPKNENLKRGLAISYEKLGDIYKALGKFDQALEYFNKYNELSKELYESNPKNESLKNGLAISYEKLGDIYQALGNFDQALEYFNKDVLLSKELYESNPKNIDLLEGLAISYYQLAMVHKAMENHQKGKEYFAQWKRIISYLAKNIPQVDKYRQWNELVY